MHPAQGIGWDTVARYVDNKMGHQNITELLLALKGSWSFGANIASDIIIVIIKDSTNTVFEALSPYESYRTTTVRLPSRQVWHKPF